MVALQLDRNERFASFSYTRDQTGSNLPVRRCAVKKLATYRGKHAVNSLLNSEDSGAPVRSVLIEAIESAWYQ